jgi:hypothetical protein
MAELQVSMLWISLSEEKFSDNFLIKEHF